LQLVQALRYERSGVINASVVDTSGEEQNRLEDLKTFDFYFVFLI
jgi:hypothetical protein